MSTPRIDINLWKIAHNAKVIKDLYASKGIEIIGVTKAVGANPIIADILLITGINILADSRISNIKSMYFAGIKAKFLLLRTPFLSQVKDVIKYADMSLNSELSVIKKISRFAMKYKKIHEIILMIDLGDLREGIMPKDIDETVRQILRLNGVKLVGIGTNLACLGGIKPDEHNMQFLSGLAEKLEKKFNISLDIISGGNSANYNWFKSAKSVGRINNLRIGESIFLGCETINREKIPSLYTDAFTLVTEVIESKIKPSLPYGDTGQDAFGNTPKYRDRGKMRRAVLGIGKQDVLMSELSSVDNFEIIGSSSDHTIINTKKKKLIVGENVKFQLKYGALLSLMTSKYIIKNLINFMNAQEFCDMIESNSIWHKEQFPTKLIRENNSPLVSLKDSGFNLIFEPSVMKNYNYLVREDIVDKIGRISKTLEKENKVLIIRSVWRSIAHQRLLWETKYNLMQTEFPNMPDPELTQNVSNFIAKEDKSMHSTGGAVDALIFDNENDCVLDFGTNEGVTINLNKKCYPYHPDITPIAKKNRKLLIGLFEKEDFVCDLKEYWHFDYGNISWAISKGMKTSIYDVVYT